MFFLCSPTMLIIWVRLRARGTTIDDLAQD
jgi:hypothetical protein